MQIRRGGHPSCKRNRQSVFGAADTCSTEHKLFKDYFKSRFLGSKEGELFLSEFRNGKMFFLSQRH